MRKVSEIFTFCTLRRYQYPPLDPMWHKILGLVMIVLGFMGWCGNGVVVYVFLMTPALRTPSNLLVINLAFSDFIMMIIMSPPMVINCYYETWVLGNRKRLVFSHIIILDAYTKPYDNVTNIQIDLFQGPLMCDIYAMVGSLCGCASIWTMTAIAVDRYNVIVKVKFTFTLCRCGNLRGRNMLF